MPHSISLNSAGVAGTKLPGVPSFRFRLIEAGLLSALVLALSWLDILVFRGTSFVAAVDFAAFAYCAFRLTQNSRNTYLLPSAAWAASSLLFGGGPIVGLFWLIQWVFAGAPVSRQRDLVLSALGLIHPATLAVMHSLMALIF